VKTIETLSALHQAYPDLNNHRAVMAGLSDPDERPRLLFHASRSYTEEDDQRTAEDIRTDYMPIARRELAQLAAKAKRATGDDRSKKWSAFYAQRDNYQDRGILPRDVEYTDAQIAKWATRGLIHCRSLKKAQRRINGAIAFFYQSWINAHKGTSARSLELARHSAPSSAVIARDEHNDYWIFANRTFPKDERTIVARVNRRQPGEYELLQEEYRHGDYVVRTFTVTGYTHKHDPSTWVERSVKALTAFGAEAKVWDSVTPSVPYFHIEESLTVEVEPSWEIDTSIESLDVEDKMKTFNECEGIHDAVVGQLTGLADPSTLRTLHNAEVAAAAQGC